MSSRHACAAAALVATALAACPAGSRSTDERHEAAVVPQLGGEVVAIVGARAIRRAQILELAEREGLTAREALDRLEAHSMLEDEARSRGLDHSVSSTRDQRERQALAQLVLRRIEREHPRSAITEADIAARAPRVLSAMARPEMRAVTHLLVRAESGADASERARVSSVAARALALARAETLDADTLTRVAAELRRTQPGADVVVETLSAFDAGAGYDAPFVAAAFGAPREGGLAPTVAETSYGAHVVHVTRVTPAVVPDAAAVRERTIRDILDSRRRRAFEALVRELTARTPPETDRALVERTLGDDSLFEAIR